MGGLGLRRVGWLAAVLSACVDLGPEPPPVPSPPPGRVEGVVRLGDPVGADNVLVGARVTFVPAAEVQTSTSPDPLVARARTSDARGRTDRAGRYSVALPAGRYFVFVSPPDGVDAAPGGDASARSIVVEGGQPYALDVALSPRPPPSATWRGSFACLGCHEAHRPSVATRHFIGVRAPARPSPLQVLDDVPSVPPGLGLVTDGDEDGVNDFEQGRVLTAEGGAPVQLGFEPAPGSSTITLGASLTVTIDGEVYPVRLTYGGSSRAGRQRFITRVAGGTHRVLPLAYDLDAPAGDRWVVEGLDTWTERSFDVDCAGCHMTVTGFFQGLAVIAEGAAEAADFDGDGAPDQVNVGCERCHGPGSAHIDAGGGYVAILNPARLAPGARNAVCGQCHQRGLGHVRVGGIRTGYPSRDAPFSLARPGWTASELSAAIEPRPSAEVAWGDAEFGSDRDHSKVSRQQYTDFVGSKMAKNALELLSCFSCHDPHERRAPAQLVRPAEDNTLCLSCHNGDYVGAGGLDRFGADARADADAVGPAVRQHVATTTFELVGAAMNDPDSAYAPAGVDDLPMGRCITCHMPKTARSGRWQRDDDGALISGDIRAHTFSIISPSTSRAMAGAGLMPVPSSCIRCHRGPPVLDPRYPDFRPRGADR